MMTVLLEFIDLNFHTFIYTLPIMLKCYAGIIGSDVDRIMYKTLLS